MTATGKLAYIDLMASDFRPDHPDVHAARAVHWCARTPMGLAVLRRDMLTRLLSDRRFAQGSHLLLDAQGITEGPLVDWMRSMILPLEGPDHTRVRRLVSAAFTPKAVTALRPRMRQITHELVDAFPDRQVEFMDAFADPYPARVLCELLGVPAELRETVRGWANDLGLAFSFTVADHRERIEAALAGVFAAADVLLDARRAQPGDDLLSTLLAAEADGERLSPAELRSLVATLLFAGQDTTRHQLGLAVATSCATPTSGCSSPSIRSSPGRPSTRSSGSRPRHRSPAGSRSVMSRSTASRSPRARTCRCSWPPATPTPRSSTNRTGSTSPRCVPRR